MRIQIGVIGASELTEDKTKLAEELGREMAKNKLNLLVGTAEGAPRLAAKGAREAGGLTIAIVFKRYAEEDLKYFDGVIFTGLSTGEVEFNLGISGRNRGRNNYWTGRVRSLNVERI
jgi:uncharacterized protein (TIGR00725 family)